MPFDDVDVLRADDPRPQRVAQAPVRSAVRRGVRRGSADATADMESERDQELRPSYDLSSMKSKSRPVFLYVERGPGQGQLMQLQDGALVIGRASVSDLRLQHPSVSRRHAQLRRAGEQFFVRDLGSQNGTFVNKKRLSTELEVQVGDSIAVGSALLKLRGPLNTGEGLDAPATASGPLASSPTRPKQRTHLPTAVVRRDLGEPKTNAFKVAMVAGGVGFGLAAVLVFALVKTMAPDVAPLRKLAASALPTARVAAPVNDLVIEAGEAVVTPENRRKVAESLSRKEQEIAAKRAAEAPAAPAESAPAEKSPAPAKVAEARGPSHAPAPKEPARAEKAESEPAPKAGRAAILKDYLAGDASSALAAAKDAGDAELSAKLAAFNTAYAAAKSAVEGNNGNAAIRSYEKALAVDKDLSKGSGAYAKEIKGELSNLYEAVGNTFLRASQDANAKKAFAAAVAYNPANAEAKQALAQLGGEVAEAAPAAKADTKPAGKKSADAAFDDDDEKPAKKVVAKAAPPAKKPASRAKAIDDAFGDE